MESMLPNFDCKESGKMGGTLDAIINFFFRDAVKQQRLPDQRQV